MSGGKCPRRGLGSQLEGDKGGRAGMAAQPGSGCRAARSPGSDTPPSGTPQAQLVPRSPPHGQGLGRTRACSRRPGSRESGWGWGGLTAPPRGSALGLQQLRKGLPRIRPPGDPPLGLVRPTHSLDPRNTLVSSERPPALTGRKRTQRGTADFPQSHPILPHRGVILPILGKQK